MIWRQPDHSVHTLPTNKPKGNKMYELDSTCREAQERQDLEKSKEWGFATLELAELVKRWGKVAIEAQLATYPDTPLDATSTHEAQCAQCVNWRPSRTLTLADGDSYTTHPFCALRAASDLMQMPQSYASRCHFYESAVPF